MCVVRIPLVCAFPLYIGSTRIISWCVLGFRIPGEMKAMGNIPEAKRS